MEEVNVELIKSFLFLAVGILAAARIVPGIHLKSNATAFLVAAVYSVVHFLLFKILFFLTLPAVFLTIGLFTIVINAVLLWLTDKLLDDFEIKSFGTTIIASLVISVVSLILKYLFFWI
ncbi:MAG: phage holin family protein [Calditrichaeota bacterium]|nr:MAG: phage holin family protein [Calditrichota bacterium]